MSEADGQGLEQSIAVPGNVLDGRYAIQCQLGSGGMGEVFLATDRRMARDVVVKVPHARFLTDPGFRARFETEVRNLTRLEHPHIVRAQDVGSVDGVPYLVLQHLAGGNLKQRLRQVGGCMPPSDVAPWLIAVADALDFIHAEGVVHRDVKPGNILFDRNGHVALADFGIAKALSTEDTGATTTGVTPGSPDYMAPEVAQGGRLMLSYDQYALAVVAYEALSGRLPHLGPTPLAVLFQKADRPPPALESVAPNVPPAAAAAIMRGLERDPAKRFHTCGELASAFARGLSSVPPVSRVSAARSVPGSPPVRERPKPSVEPVREPARAERLPRAAAPAAVPPAPPPPPDPSYGDSDLPAATQSSEEAEESAARTQVVLQVVVLVLLLGVLLFIWL